MENKNKIIQIISAGIFAVILLLSAIVVEAHGDAPQGENICEFTARNGESTNPNIDVHIITDVSEYNLKNVEAEANATVMLEIQYTDETKVKWIITADGKPAELYKDYSSNIGCVNNRPNPTPAPTIPTTSTTLKEITIQAPTTIIEAPTTIIEAAPVDKPVIGNPTYTG